MKRMLVLVGLGVVLSHIAYRLYGWMDVYLVMYGAIAVAAIFIAGTFLWLYCRQSTPLAMGMTASWLGAFCVFTWYWAYFYFDTPQWMASHPIVFVFLSIYIGGAVRHLTVLNMSFGLRQSVVWGVSALSILIPLLAVLLK